MELQDDCETTEEGLVDAVEPGAGYDLEQGGAAAGPKRGPLVRAATDPVGRGVGPDSGEGEEQVGRQSGTTGATGRHALQTRGVLITVHPYGEDGQQESPIDAAAGEGEDTDVILDKPPRSGGRGDGLRVEHAGPGEVGGRRDLREAHHLGTRTPGRRRPCDEAHLQADAGGREDRDLHRLYENQKKDIFSQYSTKEKTDTKIQELFSQWDKQAEEETAEGKATVRLCTVMCPRVTRQTSRPIMTSRQTNWPSCSRPRVWLTWPTSQPPN